MTGGGVITRGWALAATALLLAACATTPEARFARLGPLRSALATPPEILRERAERQNDGSAQMALSLLYEYGQGGVERDPVEAARLRKRAMASRGATPVTYYVPGIKGKPGRVQTMFVPRYGVDLAQASFSEACARVLDKGERTPEATKACGGETGYDQLAPLWKR